MSYLVTVKLEVDDSLDFANLCLGLDELLPEEVQSVTYEAGPSDD